jgi:type VI protein secretion system component Hcp
MMKRINRLLLIIGLSLTMFSFVFAGDPIPGIDVRLENTNGGKIFKCKTDADGNFKFDNCPEGTYSVSFSYQKISYSYGKQTEGSLDAQTLEVKSPRDIATGQASGKRMHKPFTITKEFDKASPILMLTIDGTTISGSISSREKLKGTTKNDIQD